LGHTGPRLLIHADLGRIEWKDSIKSCERLSKLLGYPLEVTKRTQGDMIDRWEQRWHDNLARYENLEVSRIISPWSSAQWRFCTSEMKVHPIARRLSEMYPGQTILNITGIRQEESHKRKDAPAWKIHKPLDDKRGCTGITWNPIRLFTEAQIYQIHEDNDIEKHVAYVKFHSSRVSCAFCILASLHDLVQSTYCVENLDAYFLLIDLEFRSSFSFQSNRWLAEIRESLLSKDQRKQFELARALARQRQMIEETLPDSAHLKKGVPIVMPTPKEAEKIAKVRADITKLFSLTPRYVTPQAVRKRYAQLMLDKTASQEQDVFENLLEALPDSASSDTPAGSTWHKSVHQDENKLHTSATHSVPFLYRGAPHKLAEAD
jgi:3'-phosphoadenosine 5'-phosphosulfate sulfotransferase (PAPS reductase)/FAD synthetase